MLLGNLRDQELVLKDTRNTPWIVPETFGGEKFGVPTARLGCVHRITVLSQLLGPIFNLQAGTARVS